jgi:plastocyanin
LSHRSAAGFAAVIAALAIPASASAATKTVAAGPPLTKPPAGVPEYADAPQFFRETTTIHVGDTVRWKIFGFHTIYFPKKGGQNVPVAVPDPSRQYAGELDPAGQAFWFNGQTQIIGNPAAFFPLGGKSENGSKATSSGVPTTEDPTKFTYKLKFPKAGTYTYYCTIHPRMKARIKVLPKSARIPSAAADKKAVDKQLAKTVADIKRSNKRKDAAGNVVEVGRDTRTTSLLNFFPAKKTVPVGTTVDFRISPAPNDPHTVTFGNDAVFAKGGYAEKLEQAIFSPLPGTGQGGPPVLGIPGAALFPSDPGALAFDGTQHGGFLNAGFLGSKPLLADSKVTFTAAGTYNYICLLHPFMKGQIVVQ